MIVAGMVQICVVGGVVGLYAAAVVWEALERLRRPLGEPDRDG